MRTHKINGFTGLNTTDDSTRTKDSELITSKNTMITSDRSLKRKLGMLKFQGLGSVDGAQIDGVFMFEETNEDGTSEKHYFCVTDGSIWKLNEATPIWEEITDPDIVLEAGERVQFLVWKNNIYFVNGKNAIAWRKEAREYKKIALLKETSTTKAYDLNRSAVAVGGTPEFTINESALILGVVDENYFYGVISLGFPDYELVKRDLEDLTVNVDRVSFSVTAGESGNKTGGYIHGMVIIDNYIYVNHRVFDKTTLAFLGVTVDDTTKNAIHSLHITTAPTSGLGDLWTFFLLYPTLVNDLVSYIAVERFVTGAGDYFWGLYLVQFVPGNFSHIITEVFYTNPGIISVLGLGIFGDFCIDDRITPNKLYCQLKVIVDAVPVWDEFLILQIDVPGVAFGTFYDFVSVIPYGHHVFGNDIYVNDDTGTFYGFINKTTPPTSLATIFKNSQIMDYYKPISGNRLYEQLFNLPDILVSTSDTGSVTGTYNMFYMIRLVSGEFILSKKKVNVSITTGRIIVKIDEPAIAHNYNRIYVGYESGGTYNILNDDVQDGQAIFSAIIILYTLDLDTVISHKKRYIEQHQNHLCMIDVGDPSTLEISEAFIDNIVEIFEPIVEGLPVTSIKSFGGRLYLGKRNRLYALDGIIPNYAIRLVSELYGVVSHETFKVILDRGIFLSEKAFCFVYGNTVNPVSDRKVKHLFRFGEPGAINISQIEKAYAVLDVVNKEYKCYLPIDSETEAKYCIIYNYDINLWYEEDKEIEVTAMTEIEDSADLPQVLIADKDGVIYQDNQGNSLDGADLPYDVMTSKIAVGQPMKLKNFRKLIINAKIRTQLTGSYRVDNKTWRGFSIEAKGDTEFVPYIVKIMNGEGKYFQMRIIGQNKNSPFEINSIYLQYEQLESTGRGSYGD